MTPSPTRMTEIRPVERASSASRSSVPCPNAQQLAFQEMGVGLFIHFGMNTFTGEGTGGKGAHPPSTFNPSALNCDDWVATAKDMGAEYAVLTVRHEEGFCLWPTKSTDYSVASSPWRNGQGDVVAEFVAACRRGGIKPCFYHSSLMDARSLFRPGDPIAWHQQWFQTTNRRLSEPGELERFCDQQLMQIRELLTKYGDIGYLWLDHIGETQGILLPELIEPFWLAIVAEARRLQPDCLILKADVYLTKDLDSHGGFHGGRSSYPLWHASTRVDTFEGQGDPVMDPVKGDQYVVWESNTVFSGGWFWDGDGVKELPEMIEHFYATIGRGSTFLPNFAPDRTGCMPALVRERARAFGAWRQATFGHPLAMTCAKDDTSSTFTLPAVASISHIVLQEDLRQGQRIAAFVLESETDHGWEQIVAGQSIGQMRILRLDTPIRTKAIRWRCTSSLGGQTYLRSCSAFGTTST